ncbi:MAG TPA: hypothetical protein VFU14_14525 [Acidimicrobiales bacterium]|nr:hypothetical protein [Acidimicrobiales bacterium]
MRSSRPLLPRILATAAALLVLPVVAGALVESTASPELDRAVPTDARVGDQPVIARHVAGDMVVDWLEEPPADADAWLDDPDGAHEDELAAATASDTHDGDGDADGDGDGDADGFVTEDATAPGGPSSPTPSPGQGFALFSASPRLLPSGYTLRLAGGDGRIDQYRDEFARAAQAASAATGLPIRLAGGRGGSVDPSRGEITIVLGDGPCGANAVGCGGPSLTSTEVPAGRVWIRGAALGLTPAQRTNLAMHELGHALGLRHHAAAWVDGVQVMHPQVTEVPSYRAGDGAGLKLMAGGYDRKAGAIDKARYAAGLLRVDGHLVSGARVRVVAAGVTKDVAAVAGRFSVQLPAAAGTHRVCATALDAAGGFRRQLGCTQVVAPGQPFGSLDAVAGSFETVRVRGWAVDPQTASPVDVELRRNGTVVQTITAEQVRADVAAARPNYGGAHGFDVEVPAVAGANEVCVRILGVGAGGNKDLGCRTVQHEVDPVGTFAVAAVSDTGVTVAGWALDPNTPAAVTVHATVDRLVPQRFQADDDRAEVAAAHPAHGAAHGFTEQLVLPPGDHEVCLTVVNVGLGADRPLGCRTVHIDAQLADVVAGVVSSPAAVLDDLPVVGDLATGLAGDAGILSGVLGPAARD